ncbi:MAG: DUF2155 domain-containing protein [Alphaproteobacteria bacterium]|nr:DUF2155 domain-containing protein [Alphaproteobacteria bacterium]
MVRRILIALTLTAGLTAAAPAVAQWGTIFGTDPPPRPPGNVPIRPPWEREPDRDPRGGLPPGPPPGSRIQTQPLPPPPGVTAAPPQQRPQTGQPPTQQRQPLRGTQQAAIPPQPQDDGTIVTPSANRIGNPTAVFSGLDKITGRIITFDVAIDETVRFGALEVTPRACYTRPPTEAPYTDGFVEVDELTLQGELRRLFTGWMFAASPGLNAVEHPIYDVWLADCKGGKSPAVTVEAKPEPPPAPPRPPQRRAQPPRQQLPPPPR